MLAVGDAEFQKKCLSKMSEVSKEGGRTVLFVSHNMAAMQNLCNRIIYLDQGHLKLMGQTSEVISTYLRSSLAKSSIFLADRKDRIGNGEIRFESIEFYAENGDTVSALQTGKNGGIRVYFSRKNNKTLNNLNIAIGVNNDMGERLTVFNNEVTNQPFSSVDSNMVEINIFPGSGRIR